MDIYEFSVPVEDAGTRVDVWLSAKLRRSRSYLQSRIENGGVRVNGETVRANYRVRRGNAVRAEIPDVKPLEVSAENIALDVLYEDSDIIVINKPKGMVVHPAAGNYSGTLVNALMHHCGDSLSGINGVTRPGIVHRLDKDTSGVLVAAKNDKAHAGLAQQIKEHSVTRRYLAVVAGNIKEDAAKIDAPIGRHPADRKKMAVNVKNGRSAVTHIRVLERFKGYTYVEARLETGRTHQIRVHMSYIGHPVLGDTVYGPKKQEFHTDGQALHAAILGFVHPVRNEYMEFEAPLPEYFQKLLKELKKI